MEGYFCMQISLLSKSYKSVGKHIKSAFSPIIHRCKKTYQVGDHLDISSLKKTSTYEDSECNGFIGMIRQIHRYKKAFGVNWWDIIKGNRIHSTEVIPVGIFDYPIISIDKIASVKVKTRSGKTIDANIDKISLGVDDMFPEYFYVLKNKNKQIGYVRTIFKSNNKVDIEYLTNILGRKKYRNTEKILVQTLVEDCLRRGFIPRIEATAENVGSLMGRGYNNLALYRKMGMHSPNPAQPEDVSIDAKEVIPLFEKYLKINGEIFKGTKERLEQLKR